MEGSQSPQAPVDADSLKQPLALDYYDTVTGVLTAYGWFILVGVGSLYVLWLKFEPKYRQWVHQRQQDDHAATYIQNPELARARQEAMEAARKRLQEIHDQNAAIFSQKLKLKEEAKRLLKIEEWNKHQEGKGYHSKMRMPEEAATTSKPVARKPKLGSDYNPLMGDPSSTSYRPSRGGGSGGG